MVTSSSISRTFAMTELYAKPALAASRIARF